MCGSRYLSRGVRVPDFLSPLTSPTLRADLPIYPAPLQLLRVTVGTVAGPAGVAQALGSSVLAPILYVSFTEQLRTDVLLPRDREPCLAADVNGLGLSPGFYLGRLSGSWTSLPVYEVISAVSTGSIGPPGPQGSEGPQGSVGLQGPQGSGGPQGSIGPQGPEGPRGSLGPAGSTGEPGTQGSPGATGSIGNPGTQGSLGGTGATGSTGQPGTQGTQGSQGIQGQTGPAGSTGNPGSQGTIGSQGPIGPIGPAGPQGSGGPQGSAGPTGSTGNPGTQGSTGPQGLQGPPGPAGSSSSGGGGGVGLLLVSNFVSTGQSTTSTTYVDLATNDEIQGGVTISEITTLVIKYQAVAEFAAGLMAETAFNELMVDGSLVGSTEAKFSAGSTVPSYLATICVYKDTFSAGNHTFKVQHKTTNGTAVTWLHRLLEVYSSP